MFRAVRITAVSFLALMIAVQPGVGLLDCSAAAEAALLAAQPGESSQCYVSEAAPPFSSPLLKNGEGKDLVRLVVKSGLVEFVTAEIGDNVSQPAHHADSLSAAGAVSSLQHLSVRWQI